MLAQVALGVSAPVAPKARHAGQGFVHWFTHLGSNIGAFGVAALVVATIALAAFVVLQTLTRPNRDLADRLEPYRLHPRVAATAEGPDAVVTVPLLRRLGEALTDLAERRGVRAALESRIRRAGLAITLGELMVVTIIGTWIPGRVELI